MSIQYTITIEDNTLFVTASGFDETLAEVEQYGLAIINAAIAGGVTRILCNEIDLEYRLDTLDTYRAAEFIAEHAPRVAKVALVCAPQYMADARFWEDVAVNRGLLVCAFKDLPSATQWLNPPSGGPDLGG